MADLGEKVAQVEGLVDKRLKFLGLWFTYTSLVAAFALISTIVGSLYGGFLMYQKVEGIANLDLGAIQSSMEATSADVLRVEEVAKEIKVELKEDLARLRTAQYNLENRLDTKLQSVDVRITTMDNKLDKFDIQMDDMEEKLMKVSEIAKMLSMSLRATYRFISKTEDFPEGINLGVRMKRWKRSEILEWIEKKSDGES